MGILLLSNSTLQVKKALAGIKGLLTNQQLLFSAAVPSMCQVHGDQRCCGIHLTYFWLEQWGHQEAVVTMVEKLRASWVPIHFFPPFLKAYLKSRVTDRGEREGKFFRHSPKGNNGPDWARPKLGASIRSPAQVQGPKFSGCPLLLS